LRLLSWSGLSSDDKNKGPRGWRNQLKILKIVTSHVPLIELIIANVQKVSSVNFLSFISDAGAALQLRAVVCADPTVPTVHPQQNCGSAQSELFSPSSFETNALDYAYLLGPPCNAASFVNGGFPQYNALCTSVSSASGG
jgi:hypothetical protein